jgi:hypothetical protein
VIKFIQAKLDGVPYRFSKLWVTGEIYLKTRPKGAEQFELLGVNRDNGRDDAIVPLLKSGNKTYFYKVTGAYCSPGDDHIISPWFFDFKYDHCEEEHQRTKGSGGL